MPGSSETKRLTLEPVHDNENDFISIIRQCIEGLLFAVVYVIAGKIGLTLHFVHESTSPIWIPTGLSLAYIYIRGYRMLPAVAVGALIVNMMLTIPWWVACCMSFGSTLEALIGVWLLRRYRFCADFSHVRDVLILIAGPTVLSTAFSALFGAGSLALADLLTQEDFWPCYTIWWLGDSLSNVVIAPFVLSWSAKPLTKRPRRDWREVAIIYAGLFSATALAFLAYLPSSTNLLLLSLGFPFLITVAIRYTARETTIAILFVTVISVLCTINSRGPFQSDSTLISICGLSVFIGIVGVTALIVNAQSSERHRSEYVLRTEHESFSEAEQLARIGSWQNSLDGQITWWSDVMYQLCGHPPDEPLGTFVDFINRYVHPEDRHQLVQESNRAVDDRIPAMTEFRLIRRNGEVLYVRSNGRPIYGEDGHISHYLGTTQDVTDQVHVAMALRTSEERYRLIADHSTDVIGRHALDGSFLYLSPSIKILLGYEPDELIGKSPYDLMHPEDLPNIQQLHQQLSEAPVRATFRSRHKDGHYIWVESNGNIIQKIDGPPEIIVQLRDVSERKRLEEQIQQAQKMDAIGRLAGGIAHDFNNLLTVINGFSEMLLQTLPSEDPAVSLVEDIHAAGMKAAGLTKQLLAFSRKQLVTRKIIDLNTTFASTEPLLKRLIGENIKLRMIPYERQASILADTSQIEQIIMNLAVNARDAMPNGGELTMTISLHHVIGEGELGDMPAGEYVVLSVADSGTGMDAATQALVFEPFFTTKEQGKGTGLGLSTVYAIMQQSKGHIKLESDIGKGSTFHLFWPSEQPSTSTLATPIPNDTYLGDGEVILIVEDDDAVRNFTARILRKRGYRVLEASDGLDALRLCEKRGSPVDLVITDVVMPHMGGRELAEKLRRIWPRTPLMFLSGYTNDIILRQSISQESVVLLTKPFTSESLLLKVRELLDQKPLRKN